MFQPKAWRKLKHILCSIFSFYGCAVYEIMWKNTAELGRTQMAI
jgi:hypothetical protein